MQRGLQWYAWQAGLFLNTLMPAEEQPGYSALTNLHSLGRKEHTCLNGFSETYRELAAKKNGILLLILPLRQTFKAADTRSNNSFHQLKQIGWATSSVTRQWDQVTCKWVSNKKRTVSVSSPICSTTFPSEKNDGKQVWHKLCVPSHC